MAVNFNSSNPINSFFNTSLNVQNNYNTSSGGINDILSSGGFNDYAAIKNGSYKKLLSAYYSKAGSNSVDEENIESINNKEISSEASSSINSLSTLKKMDISEENRNNVEKNIKELVNSYNNMIDNLAKSDTKSVLQKGVWMTKAVSSYSNVLDNIGLKVGADNRLTFDSEKFSKASMESIENVFKGNMSVGNKIMYKINQLENVATNNGKSGYTKTGGKALYDTVPTIDKYL